mmetsp:Transcript_102783/g.204085  ORF Transcript_102783/g.204085 Transcript_102783/m.204085 type:complete len:119 (+) Transcript_102783:80-436(+)
MDAQEAAAAFPSQYDAATGESSFDKVEKELRGPSLVLNCQLPDGKQVPISCHVGQDVTFVKGQLHRKLDEAGEVPPGNMKLFMDGNWMFDPLSLNDFPSIMNRVSDGAQPIAIEVKFE